MNKLFIPLLVILIGCEVSSAKLYVKSVQQGDVIVDWYVYSDITNFSPAKVQICKGDETLKIIEYGHGVTNIDLVNDLLLITTNREPKFEVDTTALKKLGLNVRYFRSSPYANEESGSRIGNLMKKHIDVTKRHFENSD